MACKLHERLVKVFNTNVHNAVEKAPVFPLSSINSQSLTKCTEPSAEENNCDLICRNHGILTPHAVAGYRRASLSP